MNTPQSAFSADSSLRQARSTALTVHRTVIHYRRLRFAYPCKGSLERNPSIRGIPTPGKRTGSE